MDDDIEEVTRKIAPSSVATISLGALPTMPSSTTINNNHGTMMTENTIRTTESSTKTASIGQQQKQKQEQIYVSTSGSRRFVWKLRSVPTLPEFYSLERTAVFIPDVAVNPSEVTERISAVLQERSIEAHYDNAKAKVKCLTVEGVDFRIRLYRGRGTRYDHGIIVEVQRRFGTSLVFHDDIQAILDGSQGKVLPPPSLLINKNILPKITDEDDDDDDDEDDEYISSSSNADSSLAMVGNMMKVMGFDSQYLALQILSSLVDSEKLSSSTARAVSTQLLQPENEVGTQIFRRIIDNDNNNNKRNSTEEKKDDENDDDEDSMILRNMSLTILAKALGSYNGSVPDCIIRYEPLRRTLLRDLMDAERHPNIALFSAKCLEYFATAIPDDDPSNLYCYNEAFEIAQRVGAKHHTDLFRQAQKCMIAIHC